MNILFFLTDSSGCEQPAMPEKRETVFNQSDKPLIEKRTDNGIFRFILKGCWNTHTVHLVDGEMRRLEDCGARKVIIGVHEITGLDTAGGWLIKRLGFHLAQKGADVSLEGAQTGWLSLLHSVGRTLEKPDEEARLAKRSRLSLFLETVGRGVVGCGQDCVMAMYILGSTIRGAQLKRGKSSSLSLPAVITQVDRMGVGAVPIIILMSFIVGAIIAQQGAFQLRYFGAEIFVVDLVGILVFRELGVLLTAIMIAGRSGSAITAEIGSMKMREETDALEVMGLNPIGVLVFPRLAALAIILPLLTIVADISALVGAAVVTNLYSGIPVDAFLTRLNNAVWLSTYFTGLIKAPFMAFIIGIIASVEGMKVGGSAESLGQRVTSSVVKSIFIVIVVDGFFAIFYAAIRF